MLLTFQRLLTFFSSNEKERKKGYWGIDNHAVVQSDLYSSAPYAARVIVDRFLKERVVSYELVNILFQLYNGYGPQILCIGPLSGEPIELLCKKIVRETELLLVRTLKSLGSELVKEVNLLIESFNE